MQAMMTAGRLNMLVQTKVGSRPATFELGIGYAPTTQLNTSCSPKPERDGQSLRPRLCFPNICYSTLLHGDLRSLASGILQLSLAEKPHASSLFQSCGSYVVHKIDDEQSSRVVNIFTPVPQHICILYIPNEHNLIRSYILGPQLR